MNRSCAQRRGNRRFGPDVAAAAGKLHAHCRAHLAAYKTPTTWVFVDSFLLAASARSGASRSPTADRPGVRG